VPPARIGTRPRARIAEIVAIASCAIAFDPHAIGVGRAVTAHVADAVAMVG